MAAVLFDIECTVHNNSQVPSTSKECSWKRKSHPNERSRSLKKLKFAKAEYGKASTKEPVKQTIFDPSSVKVDHTSFLDLLRSGLEEHVPNAVLLPLLPQASTVGVTEAELTDLISDDNIVEWEEETTTVEVDTIANMRDNFLASKEINTNDKFEELCYEFQNFSKINQDQAAMIFEKTKSQGNWSFWIEQW